MICTYCQVKLTSEEIYHNHEHPGLCCDCFDLSFGASLSDINNYRAKAGRPAIKKEWPK